MDYKEKILAEFQEKIATDITVLGAFRATNILEQILATLPSEKEIAKGVMQEMSRDGYQDFKGMTIVFDWLNKRLDKEAE